MVPKIDDILRVLPELVWCGSGVLLMLLQPFVKSRQALTFIAMMEYTQLEQIKVRATIL